jgi:hypothetical protein
MIHFDRGTASTVNIGSYEKKKKKKTKLAVVVFMYISYFKMARATANIYRTKCT